MSADTQLPVTLPTGDLTPSLGLWECMHSHAPTYIHMQNKKQSFEISINSCGLEKHKLLFKLWVFKSISVSVACMHFCPCYLFTSSRAIFLLPRAVDSSWIVPHENFSVSSSVTTCCLQSLPVSFLWESSRWPCVEQWQSFCVNTLHLMLCSGTHLRFQPLRHGDTQSLY